MSEEQYVAAEGMTAPQQTWSLLYQPAGGQHLIRLLCDGAEQSEAVGFDIPQTTEIGFAGGLTPGRSEFVLYGVAASRIRVVRAESDQASRWSQVKTEALPGSSASGEMLLRAFVLVRPPIEDVRALVGLDCDGQEVQRIPFPVPDGSTA